MFLLFRTVVCAWMALTITRVSASASIPESSAISLQVLRSCTRRRHHVNIMNAKTEYVINRTVQQTTTCANVLRDTQVLLSITTCQRRRDGGRNKALAQGVAH